MFRFNPKAGHEEVGTNGTFPSLFSILAHPNTSKSVDFALSVLLAYGWASSLIHHHIRSGADREKEYHL